MLDFKGSLTEYIHVGVLTLLVVAPCIGGTDVSTSTKELCMSARTESQRTAAHRLPGTRWSRLLMRLVVAALLVVPGGAVLAGCGDDGAGVRTEETGSGSGSGSGSGTGTKPDSTTDDTTDDTTGDGQ